MTTFDLHGIKLSLPMDHGLPQYRQVIPDYSENAGRIAASVAQKYPGRGFVDVGANIGDTATIVGAHAKVPILCIEGSDVYFNFLVENVRNIGGDIEVECAMLDASPGERLGRLKLEMGTAAFRTDVADGAWTRFEKLADILARHPRFQNAKVLKLDTDGMDGRIILGALDWIAAARPVLFWEHDVGRDAAADGPALSIFPRLFDIGYNNALIFDNRGEYIMTLPLDACQQLADVSDYLPGGEKLYPYCDICAVHEEDQDLCGRIRQIELESRRVLRQNSGTPLNEPLFRVLVQWLFDVHSQKVVHSVQQAIGSAGEQLSQAVVNRTAELETLRRQTEAERDRLNEALANKTAELETLRGQMKAERDRLNEALANKTAELETLRGQMKAERDQLNEVLANRTVEIQSLRGQMEAERYRMQLLAKDQEKRISRREAEIARLHGFTRELIANELATNQTGAELNNVKAQFVRLRGELESSIAENARLHYEIKTSLALRAARYLGWILGPIRKLIGPTSAPQGRPL